MGLFENEPVCSFQADGGTAIPISLLALTEETEYRLIERERAFRPGAKLDTTGRKKSVFSLDSLWQEGIDEPGIPQSGYYPGLLNQLMAAFDGEKAGTLRLPFRTPLRVRCKTARRAEKFDERDMAAVSLTFWTDNEDTVTAASFTKVSPQVGVPMIYADFSDAAQLVGLMSADVLNLGNLVATLSGFLAAGIAVADITLTALALIDTADSIEGSFSNRTTNVGPDVGRILSDPESWRAARLLRRLAAQAAAAARLPNTTAPSDVTQVISFRTEVSLFDVAARDHQDLGKLLELNAGYENPFLIPANSPIRIVTV